MQKENKILNLNQIFYNENKINTNFQNKLWNNLLNKISSEIVNSLNTL